MKRRRRRTIDKVMAEGTLIDEALLEASRTALLLHKRAGLAVPIWRNGRIVMIPSGQIEIPEAKRSRRRRT